MSTERERRKAQMRAATTRRTADDAPAAGRTAIRSKPVRITVDLNPEAYRQLMSWTTTAAAELDVPRVTAADAIRAMIRVTEGDEYAGSAVVKILRENREQ